jgi:sirohydrochlorin cobaltochelatase
MSIEDRGTLDALEVRLKTILPKQYQDCYEDLQPVSMGSASLKYTKDGKVAWNDIWQAFCDLAMAGGPPHKGKLLEPGSPPDIAAQIDRYREVEAEIRRGITMVTGLAAEPSPIPGWVRVDCASYGMAGWLVRAIVMENVSARCEGPVIELPAGPDYRIEKEIKNVITVTAKTCHYWLEHMPQAQRRDIANLFARMSVESPLLQPALSDVDLRSDKRRMLCGKIAETIRGATGRCQSGHQYAGWLGIECADVRAAIWMMRAMVASNILSRREGTVLFVPLNPESDPNGETVARSVVRIHAYLGGQTLEHLAATRFNLEAP